MPHPLSQALESDCDGSPRAKRRRLEAQGTRSSSNGHKGIRYGRYGQVEPGPLRMEIVTCPSRVLGSYHRPSTSHPTNMLNNQPTLYCADATKFNVVLQHHGGTVFRIKELVLQTPVSLGFAAKISAGLIFAFMDHDDTLTSTTKYEIVSASRACLSNHWEPESGEPRLSRVESVLELSMARYWGNPTFGFADQNTPDWDDSEDEMEQRFAVMPPEWLGPSTSTSATTRCDRDREMFEMERLIISQHHSASRGLSHNVDFVHYNEDRDNIPEEVRTVVDEYISSMGLDPSSNWAFQSQQQRAANSALADVWQASQIAAVLDHNRPADLPRPAPAPPTQPIAKFHLDEFSNQCIVKFDPPVSARFLVLKMWNPQVKSGHLAIQSITVKGYAGPRYIPAVHFK